jgi:hypothetical protein
LDFHWMSRQKRLKGIEQSYFVLITKTDPLLGSCLPLK